MDQVETTSATKANGESALRELFALTDEQILGIEPQEEVASGESRVASGEELAKGHWSVPPTESGDVAGATARTESAARPSSTSRQSPVTSHNAAEPPAWVAEAMSDPQRGREARAFWEGTQKTQQEAAAYREVFAKPEEARAAAERARVLDEIDRAYFGATGNSAEQTSAARAQLAQRMLQENPAAFREMVLAGLRALEEAGKQGSTEARNVTDSDEARNAQFAAYAAFEKAANEELEKSVGGAIERTIERALPNIAKTDRGSVAGAQHPFGSAQDRAAPLQARLQSAIRQEVEAALKGDRQLSEQIALIISGRLPGDAGTPTPRFDGDARAQVVRLIDERAKQLVPGAAKRVLQDWTQTTLATHRSRTRQNDTAAARSDLAPANSAASNPPPRSANTGRDFDQDRSGGNRSGKVDYRKLSDEQILDL